MQAPTSEYVGRLLVNMQNYREALKMGRRLWGNDLFPHDGGSILRPHHYKNFTSCVLKQEVSRSDIRIVGFVGGFRHYAQ